MKPKTKAIFSILLFFNLLPNWITVSATEGVTYQQIENSVASNTTCNAKDILQELLENGLVEMVDGCKYVISKKELKNDCQSETPVNSSFRPTATERATVSANSSSGEACVGIKAEYIAGMNAVLCSAGTYAGYIIAGIRAGLYNAGINVSPAELCAMITCVCCIILLSGYFGRRKFLARKKAIVKAIVKRPNAAYMQNSQWMRKQDILIEDRIITFKLDTGAQVNIMPLWLFNDFNLIKNSNFCNAKGYLVGLGNNEVEIEGVVSLQCSTESVKNKELIFTVVNLPMVPMLGLYGCEELKLKTSCSEN